MAISWTWNCWWTLKTPSPNGCLIVCTMCMLPQCITAWWELSRRYVTIFSTKHFVPKLVHKFCVCTWTIHGTGECSNSLKTIFSEMPFLSKWCEQLSVFMALVDQIKGFDLALSPKGHPENNVSGHITFGGGTNIIASQNHCMTVLLAITTHFRLFIAELCTPLPNDLRLITVGCKT